jgi:hypothetical protein
MEKCSVYGMHAQIETLEVGTCLFNTNKVHQHGSDPDNDRTLSKTPFGEGIGR